MYTSSHSLHHPHNLTDPVDWPQGPLKRTATKRCYSEIINTAVFGLAMSMQSGAVMLHVSLWKLQVRFASDVEKKCS